MESAERQRIIDDFAKLWWDERDLFFGQTWLGIPTLQHPFDAWITQEIIVETRPERIVEAGSFYGGSATMWAQIQESVVPDGRVIAIDVFDNMTQARENDIFRRRVDFLRGSTTKPDIVDQVKAMTAGYRTMVILDSAHGAPHVSQELAAYSAIVTPGCYLIVQDGFVNGHPCDPEHGPGPFEATQEFLSSDHRFEVDKSRERMLFTFNPGGYLKRV